MLAKSQPLQHPAPVGFQPAPPKGNVLRCGIECDGGGFELKARKDGRLLLKTGSYGFRVVRRGAGCGGEDADMRQITRKTDDRVFLLSRLSDLRCVVPAPPKQN